MKRAHVVIVLLIALIGAASASAFTRQQQRATFPHDKHARLFPVCAGCHEGITSAAGAVFPKRELCANCHDGKRMPNVAWTGPTTRVSNLVFDHIKHAKGNTGAPLECASCHQRAGTTARMAIAIPVAQQCISCHTHTTPTHISDATNCGTCHMPLARAERVTVEYASHYEKPPTHKTADFMTTHKTGATAAGAQCSICHTRETCVRCHLNAASIPAIAAMESAPRFAVLWQNLTPRYAPPASHKKDTWDVTHASVARGGVASCANCHTQASCRTCHIGTGASKAIESLPKPARPDPERTVALRTYAKATSGAAVQVPLATEQDTTKRRLTRVHPARFATNHKAAAALDQPKCSGCHTTTYCTSCHQTAARPVFHPANFVARHANESFSAKTTCSSCHNTEAFCRACHQTTGIAARAAGATAFHDRKPLWLLQHGQAARQGLESCTSCHRQNDCTRCHSAAGWRVNPHGADFDAQRMSDRNRITCQICHIGDPLKR